MRRELRHLIYVVIAAVFFIGLFVLCDRFSKNVVSEYSSQINPSMIGRSSGEGQTAATISDVDVEDRVIDMVESDYSVNLKLTVAGEIMCQNQQLTQAYDEQNGTFSFANGLEYIKDDLSGGDFTVSALGTTMAGSGNGYSSDIYGYCASDGMYNSPESLATDLKDAGISLLDTATNHAFDSGSAGVSSTIDYLTDAGIEHIGTAKSESDSKDYVLKSNYVNIVFTAYTESLNNQTLPDDESYEVNTLDDSNESKISEMCSHVNDLSKDNDYVVVMLNFGTADSTEIESDQRNIARDLAQSGADVILGYGSRAVKPMELLTVTGNDGLQRTCTVFYGLGAVYSSDYYSEYENLDTDISVIINLNLRNAISGDVELTGMEVIPVYLNWYNGLVQPVPVCETKDSDKYSSVLDEDDMTRIDSAYSGTITQLLGDTGLKSTYDKDNYLYSVSFN